MHRTIMLLRFSIFLIFNVFFSFSSFAHEQNDEQFHTGDTLVVGCEIGYPPFCYKEDGEATGFAVELFTAAAREMNLHVVYKTGVWSNLKQNLANGHIDALPLVGRTPEREAIYDFTIPYLTMYGCIVVREGNEDILSLEDLRNKEVGVMAGDNAEEFLHRVGLQKEAQPTATFREALKQLSGGQYDAIVIQRLLALQLMEELDLQNLKIVAEKERIYSQDFCFAVKKGNAALLSRLNEGLYHLRNKGKYRSLRSKWLGGLEAYREAQKWVIVGGDYNYPPYEYLDENGNPTGYNVELMRAIAKNLDLNIYIEMGPWDEIRQKFDEGKIDVMQGILYSAERDKKFDMTPAHTQISYVIVTRRDTDLPESLAELEGKAVLVQDKDLIHEHALKHGLKDELVPVVTQEKALKLLSEGVYDYALASRVLLHYFEEKNNWRNLQSTKTPVHSAEYCIGVQGGNMLMLSEFTEGLAAIKASGEYREIHSRWLGIYEEQTLDYKDFIRRAFIVFIPLIVLLLASFIWSRTLNNRVQKRTYELQQEKDTLKRTEFALRASERKYRNLFSSIQDAILVTDKSRKVIDCNPAFVELFGYTFDEIEGKETSMFFEQKEDYKNMGEELITREKKSQAFFLNLNYRKKDGTVFPGEVNLFYLEDKAGEIRGYIGLIRDITEREKNRKALEESKETAENYLNIAAEIILTLDLDGTISLLNDSGHKLLGYERGSLEGKNWLETCLPEEQKEPVRNLLYDLSKGQTKDIKIIEGLVLTKSGEKRSILWHNSVLKDDYGHATGLLTSGEDITEKKKTEEKLRLINNEIAAQNEEYEAINEELNEKNDELLNVNRQLNLARKKAEESDKLKSSFLANISHEIRTPMNGILGFSNLLKNPKLKGEKKEKYIELIQQSGERMLDIISNLLDISKIEAGHVEIFKEPTNINDLMTYLFDFFKAEAEKKQLKLTKSPNLEEDKAFILTDYTKLNQIMVNLIKNAIKYTHEGEVQFGCTHEGKHLRFYVKDTGIGIPTEVQTKIFERFRQAELIIAREYEGAGLGLSISKAFVEMLGGTIHLESVPEKGSTFSFTIPAELPKPVEEFANKDLKEHEAKVNKSYTLLIAEDDGTSYYLMEEILIDQGFNLLHAKNGKEAVEMVNKKGQIDLILMDVKMPVMDGYQAIAKIREAWPDIPVIAQTAFASPRDEVRALKAGANDFISKPINENIFLEKIRDLLQSSA